MKIFSFVGVWLLVAGAALGQTEVIHHRYYTTTYNKRLHYPVLVEWWDYTARCSCEDVLERKDQFAPDPEDEENTDLVKAYRDLNRYHKEHPTGANGGKGYDKGHMCPAADNECMGAEALKECFYFSNMAAQTHMLNAGDWKKLETRTRVLCAGDARKHIAAQDSIHVWCGATGSAEKNGPITVPEKCWKVLYIKKKRQYEAYIFDNTYSKPQGLQRWKTTVRAVEELTGFRFVP